MSYVFSAVAALVGLAGAWQLRRQSVFWAGGLLIGGLAALAYASASAGSPWGFKLYYALGASMLPGWIGAGSLYAVFSRRLARWPAMFVLLLSAIQLGLTLSATVNGAALAGLNGGNGAGVLVMGAWVVPTVLFNTLGLGFAAVAAFLAWWRAFRIQQAQTGAVAIGLSLVVIGILCRSDAVYKMMVAAGAGSGFPLADAAAFALIWAGASAARELPAPLKRLLANAAQPERLVFRP